MICARQRRLEAEAHEDGRHECLDSAEELGLNMSCQDEYECGAPEECQFFLDALARAKAFDECLP